MFGSPSKQPRFSFIIPALNEASRIGDTLAQVASWLNKLDIADTEVVVVAAQGRDNTADTARGFRHLFENFHVLEPGTPVGKGRDVAYGMLHATGEYRLFFDADLATPLHHLEQVMTFADNSGSIGIGVRDVGTYHNSRSRNLLSLASSILTRMFIDPKIRDTQCGFKVFEANLAIKLFSRIHMSGWTFDMELLALARNLGYRVTSFPITDWHDPKEAAEGLTGESRLKAIIRCAAQPIKVRLRILANRYNGPGPMHKYLDMAAHPTQA